MCIRAENNKSKLKKHFFSSLDDIIIIIIPSHFLLCRFSSLHFYWILFEVSHRTLTWIRDIQKSNLWLDLLLHDEQLTQFYHESVNGQRTLQRTQARVFVAGDYREKEKRKRFTSNSSAIHPNHLRSPPCTHTTCIAFWHNRNNRKRNASDATTAMSNEKIIHETQYVRRWNRWHRVSLA